MRDDQNLPPNHDMPVSLDALSPPWLTNAFANAGFTATVADVSASAMPGIVGAIGEVGIVDVTYADNPDGLPTSFVGKCPLDDDFARMANEVMQMYSREVGFYRDLRDEVDLIIPQCFVSESDASGHQTMMLLERCDGVDGDIIAGTSFANMTRLSADLGKMHGQFFDDQRLLEFPWALDWLTESFKLGIPIIQAAFAEVRETEPEVMPSKLWDFLDQGYVNRTSEYLTMMNDRPWTFTHGDYELDNMLMKPSDTDDADQLVILDWQTVMRTFPGMDFGFFLMSSSNDEAIRREDELIDTYHDALLAAGGPAWSSEDVLNDCAWAVPHHVVGSCVTATTDISGYGDNEERMRARFDRFRTGMIAAANRWDVIDRVHDS